MCIILREGFSLLEEIFPREGAKWHQINGALKWLVGCKDSIAARTLKAAASSGNERFL